MKEKDECLKKDDMIQVLFMKLIHGYTANGFQKFKDLGVHPGQLPILSRLHEKEGASQRELADMLHIKPPTVTVTIRRLEKAELVYRKTDESDLRVTRIYLTEKGKALALDAIEQRQRRHEEMFSCLSEPEKTEKGQPDPVPLN